MIFERLEKCLKPFEKVTRWKIPSKSELEKHRNSLSYDPRHKLTASASGSCVLLRYAVEQEDVAHAPRRMVTMDAEDAAKYLAGFNANARLPASLFGLTLLEVVLLSDREELVKPMLDAGVNPFTADAKGYTAVEVALDRGQLDSAKMMLDTVRSVDDDRRRVGFRGPSTVSYTRAVIRSIEEGLDVTEVLRNSLQPPLKADGADVPARARLRSLLCSRCLIERLGRPSASRAVSVAAGSTRASRGRARPRAKGARGQLSILVTKGILTRRILGRGRRARAGHHDA